MSSVIARFPARRETKQSHSWCLLSTSLSGFTLMEVLIALMILAVGLASVFALLGTGAQSHRRGVRDAVVSAYAQTILAELESGVHPAIVAFQSVKDQTHPGFPSFYKYDLEFKKTLDLNDNLMVAVLTIKWPYGNKFDSVKFETVLLKK